MWDTGDLVRLNSGGPEMTVVVQIDRQVHCTWADCGVGVFHEDMIQESYREPRTPIIVDWEPADSPDDEPWRG